MLLINIKIDNWEEEFYLVGYSRTLTTEVDL